MSTCQEKIPKELAEYFEKYDLDISIFDLIDEIPRFVRLREKHSNPICAKELNAEINDVLKNDKEIDFVSATPLPDFVSLPSQISIRRLPAFKLCRIFGMD